MPQMPGMSAMRSAAGCDGAVAGGRADDLHEGADANAGSDGAVMRVEAAHGDRDARAKAERTGPVVRERAPRGRPGGYARSYRRSRSSASFGSSRARKAADGRPPQVSAYIALCPAAQTQRTILPRVLDAAEHGRDEVGQLDPARGGVEHVRRHVEAVPDLRPPPLRRVHAADRREIFGRMLARDRGDTRGLIGRGVILPQPGVRGEVRRPARGPGPADASARPPGAAWSRWYRRRFR